MKNDNLIVITGGPGAGKTAVIEELARRGFATVPEVARQIIKQQVEAKGTALPWADTKLYTQLMLSRSIESYHQVHDASSLTFLDRGIPDVLCYARIISLPDTRALEEGCATYRYNRRVFMFPPWEEIYSTDSERKQSFAEAVQVYKTLLHAYEDSGYETREVPPASVSARSDFILANCSAGVPTARARRPRHSRRDGGATVCESSR